MWLGWWFGCWYHAQARIRRLALARNWPCSHCCATRVAAGARHCRPHARAAPGLLPNAGSSSPHSVARCVARPIQELASAALARASSCSGHGSADRADCSATGTGRKCHCDPSWGSPSRCRGPARRLPSAACTDTAHSPAVPRRRARITRLHGCGSPPARRRRPDATRALSGRVMTLAPVFDAACRA